MKPKSFKTLKSLLGEDQAKLTEIFSKRYLAKGSIEGPQIELPGGIVYTYHTSVLSGEKVPVTLLVKKVNDVIIGRAVFIMATEASFKHNRPDTAVMIDVRPMTLGSLVGVRREYSKNLVRNENVIIAIMKNFKDANPVKPNKVTGHLRFDGLNIKYELDTERPNIIVLSEMRPDYNVVTRALKIQQHARRNLLVPFRLMEKN